MGREEEKKIKMMKRDNRTWDVGGKSEARIVCIDEITWKECVEKRERRQETKEQERGNREGAREEQLQSTFGSDDGIRDGS